MAEPSDMVIAFGEPAAAPDGCLTIGFEEGAAEWTFVPPTDDPFVRQELIETLYHVLWESVHVFFEHLGSSRSDAGARELPLSVPLGGGRRQRQRRGRRGRRALGRPQGARGRRAAPCARRRRHCDRSRRAGRARAPRGRRGAARVRERRLCHGRDGRRCRLPRGAAGLAPRCAPRPDGGPLDPDGTRKRRRRRGACSSGR